MFVCSISLFFYLVLYGYLERPERLLSIKCDVIITIIICIIIIIVVVISSNNNNNTKSPHSERLQEFDSSCF